MHTKKLLPPDTFLVSKYLKIEFAAGAADPADGPHSTLQSPDRLAGFGGPLHGASVMGGQGKGKYGKGREGQ